MDACREQGVEEPTWRWDGGFVIVTFKRPNKETVSAELSPEQDTNATPVATKHDPSTTQARLKYDPSTTQVKQIIKVMGDDYMGLSEIMTIFELRSPKRFRENYLNPAIAEGAVERLYPDQPKHPKQKYRLTEAAKAWKNSQTLDRQPDGER